MITWVIGQGGLLGSALARRSLDRFEAGAVPWQNPSAAREVLIEQAHRFKVAARERPWRVIWAAGSATTSTPHNETERKLIPLEGLVTGLRSALPDSRGCFFLASSAGGAYAGSTYPPFSLRTQPAPLSPYGELKLAQEKLVSHGLSNILPVIIGRLSNLYGPSQNLNKTQGIISHLARAAATREPVNIFVPLQTTRDYMTADDAAAAILSIMNTPRKTAVSTEIIAMGRGVTIGTLIRTMNEIAKRRVPVALGSHPSAAAQPSDLRLLPSVALPQITPLPVGMKAVHDDIAKRLRYGPLTGACT